MEVIGAGKEHLAGVSSVLHAAFYEAYVDLLSRETIAHALADQQSPSALKRRILAGELVVALEDGEVVGCAIAEERDDHVDVPVLVVDPDHRHHGIGSRLIEELRRIHEGVTLCISVLLGSLEGEHFMEQHGFVPGETIERVLGRQQIVERRWWLAAP